MKFRQRIKVFVAVNTKASNRFKHFILRAVGYPSEVEQAILLTDGTILLMETGDNGFNDFTNWTIPELSDNLNKFCDCLQASRAERRKFFDQCTNLFEFGQMTAGEVPILFPDYDTGGLE